MDEHFDVGLLDSDRRQNYQSSLVSQNGPATSSAIGRLVVEYKIPVACIEMILRSSLCIFMGKYTYVLGNDSTSST
jgi:hypothetical protein